MNVRLVVRVTGEGSCLLTMQAPGLLSDSVVIPSPAELGKITGAVRESLKSAVRWGAHNLEISPSREAEILTHLESIGASAFLDWLGDNAVRSGGPGQRVT